MALLQSKQLPENWYAPSFSLPATDGKTYSLDSCKDKKGLCVIFTCNHCPYAVDAWPKTIEIAKKYMGEVGFVAINPNDAENYPADSFEEMKKKAKEWQISFPYLRDESQEAARAYEAQCTPDIYLFKNEGSAFALYYHARVDELDDAIENLLAKEPPPENPTPSQGCSIKWK